MIENSQAVTLNAPKGSATMKSSEKGIGMSLHKFSFSQVFNIIHVVSLLITPVLAAR